PPKGDTMIRAARSSDAAAVQAIYAPYVNDTPITFDVVNPTEAEFAERIVTIQKQYPWIVCERQGVIVGYAYACQHRTREAYRWSVDVAIYVRQGFAGQGIGKELYEVLLKEVRALGFANAFAGITLPNPGSVGLHEAMGFEPIGVYQKVGYK